MLSSHIKPLCLHLQPNTYDGDKRYMDSTGRRDAALGPVLLSICAMRLLHALWPAVSPKTYGHVLDLPVSCLDFRNGSLI